MDDHLRTRLTRTLEVSQIAQTIAKILGVNQTLVEAISLGHDVGHTPFGHSGERTLNHILNGCEYIKNFNQNLPEPEKGFKHNWQGIRVLTNLERINNKHIGLNLTNYTLLGILNHSSLYRKKCDNHIKNQTGEKIVH